MRNSKHNNMGDVSLYLERGHSFLKNMTKPDLTVFY